MPICREHPTALFDGDCMDCLRERVDKLEAKVERLRERLRYLAKERIPEGFVHLEMDCYDYAMVVAAERGHIEPDEDDEFDGFCRMIDDAIKKEEA